MGEAAGRHSGACWGRGRGNKTGAVARGKRAPGQELFLVVGSRLCFEW